MYDRLDCCCRSPEPCAWISPAGVTALQLLQTLAGVTTIASLWFNVSRHLLQEVIQWKLLLLSGCILSLLTWRVWTKRTRGAASEWSRVWGQTWARVGTESDPQPSVAVSAVASGQTVEHRDQISEWNLFRNEVCWDIWITNGGVYLRYRISDSGRCASMLVKWSMSCLHKRYAVNLFLSAGTSVGPMSTRRSQLMQTWCQTSLNRISLAQPFDVNYQLKYLLRLLEEIFSCTRVLVGLILRVKLSETSKY